MPGPYLQTCLGIGAWSLVGRFSVLEDLGDRVIWCILQACEAVPVTMLVPVLVPNVVPLLVTVLVLVAVLVALYGFRATVIDAVLFLFLLAGAGTSGTLWFLSWGD